MVVFSSRRPTIKETKNEWLVLEVSTPPAWKANQVANLFASQLDLNLSSSLIGWISQNFYSSWQELWWLLHAGKQQDGALTIDSFKDLYQQNGLDSFELIDYLNQKNWKEFVRSLREIEKDSASFLPLLRFLQNHIARLLSPPEVHAKSSYYFKKIQSAAAGFSQQELLKLNTLFESWETATKRGDKLLEHQILLSFHH